MVILCIFIKPNGWHSWSLKILDIKNWFPFNFAKKLLGRYFVVQFIILNPWKVPWNWIVFCQNSFAISPGLLYHLIIRNSGRLPNEAFTSSSVVFSKQWLNGLKITNWVDWPKHVKLLADISFHSDLQKIVLSNLKLFSCACN